MSRVRLTQAQALTKISQLPEDISFLKARMQNIKNYVLGLHTIHDINFLFQVNEMYSVYYPETLPPSSNWFYIFRVRRGVDENKREEIQTFSHPTVDQCTENWRAHIAGSPVFYGSDDLQTSLKETFQDQLHKNNEIAYIGYWKLQNRSGFTFTGYLSPNMPETNQVAKLLLKRRDDLIETVKNDYPKYIEHVLCYFDFYCNALRDDEKPYKLSSYIANQSLYVDRQAEFIIYPSYANFNKANNFAFHPDFLINGKLVLDFVHKVSLIDQVDDIRVDLLEVGECDGKNISWRSKVFKDDLILHHYIEGDKTVY